MPFALAVLNRVSMFSTVLLASTLLPTTPQVTPSGLRKSFCGSVTTSAVRPGSTCMPGSGRAAMAAETAVLRTTAADRVLIRFFMRSSSVLG